MNAILVILGIIALVGALTAAIYTTTQTNEILGGLVKTNSTRTPYSGYALPLGAMGLVLVIVGLASDNPSRS